MRALSKALGARAWAPLLVGLSVLAACEQESPAPNQALTLEAGHHVFSIEAPPDWAHFDHGAEHRFRRGLAQISIADAGPVTPSAYRAHVQHALRLFRRGQREDARDQLRRLDLQHEFPDVREWRRFLPDWRVAVASGLGDRHDDVDVENAYLAVFAAIDGFESRSLEELVRKSLPRIDTSVHRSIARMSPLKIDGREARLVETWDTLSHDHPRSFLFVLNGGRFLVARMELGEHAVLQPAFELIVGTLTMDPAEPTRP